MASTALRSVRSLALCVAALAAADGVRADEPAPFPEIAPADLTADAPARLILGDAAPAEAPGAEFLPEVAAEPELDDIDSLLKRIEELEAAEARRTSAEEQQAAEEQEQKAEEARKALDWTDVSSEKWTVRLAGHVQMDYINWANASASIPNTQDYFEFRRLRLVADGTGYGVYDFRLQFTLEPETIGESPVGSVMSPDVKDAYFSINEVPWLGRVRIGNFFVPFSLEQVTNDTNNIFLERSIPTQGVFSPDREVGLAIYNCTDDQSISWASGVFFDNVSEGLKEKIDNNQGYRASARLNWVPYYDELSNGRYVIHTGIGLLYTEDSDDRVRFRSRPQIHEGPRIIDSGVLPADSYTTGNLELALVMGQVTVQSEAFASTVNMLTGDNETVHGGYAHISWFLTGENRIYERFGQHGAQFGRNVPFSNVFATPQGCSWGAWELKARYSHLNLNSVNRGEYNDATIGFNWYWSDRVRVMFDYIHPITSQAAVFGATESDILGTRFDFNW